MTSIGTRITVLCAAALAAVFLSACGGTSEHAGHESSPVTTVEDNPHNAVDMAFAEDMVLHHHQAVALAGLVDGRSTNKAVIALADQISAQQLPEVTALSALLAQWTASDPIPSTSDPESHDHDATGGGMPNTNMQGMVDSATMAKLETLSGPAFDTLWLQSMIGHHQGAIAMAKTEISDGQNSDMIAMATNIVAVQQAEIDQMKKILEGK